RRLGATDGPIHVELADKRVTTHLTAAAGGPSEVLIGDGPGESVLDRVPLVMVRRRAPTARFACILEPVSEGSRPAVTAVEAEQAPADIRVTIRRRGTTDTVVLADDSTFTVRSGGKVVLQSRSR
ncbi:MAG: hypothetical protein WBF17_08600, partial [Phycisphaerae bacterium]